MQMKASVEYGLKAVLYLADKEDLVSSREISREMGIPRDYLIQLAQLLRNAGIVEARPGKYGGYRLAEDPAEITLLAVLSALNDGSALSGAYDEVAPAVDADGGARGESESVCLVKRACWLAQAGFASYLDGISLATLLERAKRGDS